MSHFLISWWASPWDQKTGHLPSRLLVQRDAGQIGWKTGRPVKNGTGGNPSCHSTPATQWLIINFVHVCDYPVLQHGMTSSHVITPARLAWLMLPGHSLWEWAWLSGLTERQGSRVEKYDAFLLISSIYAHVPVSLSYYFGCLNIT